jgi:predicted nucleic acid-binding protein
MSAAFLDNNVLVYCTDAAAPAKQRRAGGLVERLSSAGAAVVSTPVLIELFPTLPRKQKMPPSAARSMVLACTAWPVIDSDLSLVASGIDTR